MITLSTHGTQSFAISPIQQSAGSGVCWRTIKIIASNNQTVHLDIFAEDPAVLALPSNTRRPTVDDQVVLLEGGAEGTCATPRLVEGRIYTIEIDDESPSPYQLQGPGSWVMANDIALI